MKRFLLLLSALLLLCSAASLSGQEKNAPPSNPALKSMNTYRLTFSLYELENGKRVNQRDYSLVLSAGATGRLNAGTRVPIMDKADQVNYTNVGLDIRSGIDQELAGNRIFIYIDVELSNFAVPEQNANPQNAPSRPIFRNVHQDLRAALTVGKPTLVASVDDVTSNRKMQLEVTATKLD